MPGIAIDGTAIAARVRAEAAAEVARLRAAGRPPFLVAVAVGEDEASEMYLRNQKRGCEAAGIDFHIERFEVTIAEESLLRYLARIGGQDFVTGIILQMPLPPHVDACRAQAMLPLHKDVEGVHPANLGMVAYGRRTLFPCTALSVLEILDAGNVQCRGAEAVVVGHSTIAGKPTALLLLDRLATVTVCHVETRDLASHTRRADILVVAVGKPGLVRGDMVKPGATVVDIGINRVGGRTVGDCAFDEVIRVAGAVTPVPGGAGPVTVAMLLRNTVAAARLQAGAPRQG